MTLTPPPPVNLAACSRAQQQRKQKPKMEPKAAREKVAIAPDKKSMAESNVVAEKIKALVQ